MKKIILICLCGLMMAVLSACASAPAPEPAPDEDEMGGWEEEMTGDEGFPEDMFVPDLSNTYNEDLVAAFTPDDAYIHSDVESMLVLESKKSMSDMITFCLAAVERLGIEKIDIDDTDPGFWVFNGSFKDLSVHIELRDDGGSVNLMLLY